MAKRTTARAPLGTTTDDVLPLPDLATTLASDATPDTGGGFLQEAELYPVGGVAALAEIAALNAWTVAAFLRETGEFQECRPGQGAEGCFLISECFTLAVWGELARCGFSLNFASHIVPRSLDVYGLMRGGCTRLSLSLNPNRLGQPSLGGETAITLDLWRLWLEFLPRWRAYVVRQRPHMRGALAAFEERVQDVREALEAGL